MKDDLIKLVFEELNKGNWASLTILFCVGVSVLIAFRIKSIIEFIDERRKSRIYKLNEALNCAQISGETRSFLENEIVKEHFRLCTGINVEDELRKALINNHKESEGELEFLHFRRARPHIEFIRKENEILIKINWIERVIYYIAYSIAIFCVFAGFTMFFQTFPVFSAKKIQKYLAEKNK
jgi:hypothetical protein